MEMPLLISVNLLSNISLVAIFVHSQKNILSEIRVKSKTFGDRAFEKIAPKLWNNLPPKHQIHHRLWSILIHAKDPPFW